MTSDQLNRLLKKHDLGDDFLEKNILFDKEFSSLTSPYFLSALIYANNKMGWYWANTNKFYLLADCNRWHFMWLGHFQEWLTKHEIPSPAIGRAYGIWEGQNHAWAWAVTEDELMFVNWGEEVTPSGINYSGKGSVAV